MQKIEYTNQAVDLGVGAALMLATGPGAPDLTTVPNYLFNRDRIRLMYFLWTREFHRAAHELRAAIWAYGPTGSGKTSFFEQFFGRLGVPMLSVNAHADSQVEDWLMVRALVDGSTVEIYGLLTRAMRLGVPFLINEGDKPAPEQLAMLNDIAERGIAIIPSTGETIRAERGFMIIVTANSNGAGDETGAYVGANVQDRATMGRFWMTEFDSPSSQDIRQQLLVQVPLLAGEDNVLDKVIQLYEATVAMAAGTHDRIRLGAALNMRELVAFVNALMFYAPYAQKGVKVTATAMDLTFAGKFDSGTRRMLIEFAEGVFGESGVVKLDR